MHGTHSLTHEDDNEADEGPDDSTTSNDESSESEKAPDVDEHVAPAVENLLVVDSMFLKLVLPLSWCCYFIFQQSNSLLTLW